MCADKLTTKFPTAQCVGCMQCLLADFHYRFINSMHPFTHIKSKLTWISNNLFQWQSYSL